MVEGTWGTDTLYNEWVETGNTEHPDSFEKELEIAQVAANMEAVGAKKEREEIVRFLRKEAAFFWQNRNIGPYAEELAKKFENGAHLLPYEP